MMRLRLIKCCDSQQSLNDTSSFHSKLTSMSFLTHTDVCFFYLLNGKKLDIEVESGASRDDATSAAITTEMK